MHEINLGSVRGDTTRGKVDIDRILQDAHHRPSWRPRHRIEQPPSTWRSTATITTALLLLAGWLAGPTTLQAVLSTVVRAVTSQQQVEHDSQALHTMPLRSVVLNATSDFETFVSLVRTFFEQTDPALELRFKQFMQQQATRCVRRSTI